MNDLSIDVEKLKKTYREIFLQVSNDVASKIENMNEEEILQFLNNDAFKIVYENHTKILSKKENYSCIGCASCCKLACSEFSYDLLKEKALNGDNYAKQFISVFVPYTDENDAKAIYPEYFELLKETNENQNAYYYFCPKVTDDNRCPDYENRPQICKDFPDNPIGFLPKTCGYKNWKSEVEGLALYNNALMEIVSFYRDKLLSAI